MQFADHPKVEFSLNTYHTRQEVIDKLPQLMLTGGSVVNTGAAISYTLKNMFSSTNCGPNTVATRSAGYGDKLCFPLNSYFKLGDKAHRQTLNPLNHKEPVNNFTLSGNCFSM